MAEGPNPSRSAPDAVPLADSITYARHRQSNLQQSTSLDILRICRAHPAISSAPGVKAEDGLSRG